jgi:hypothetical protein
LLHIWLKGVLSRQRVVPIWQVTPPWELQQPRQSAKEVVEKNIVIKMIVAIFI